jgi:hypothetical protein
MDNLLAGGHRQLVNAQMSGLSAAWRRAAEAVEPDPARWREDEPARPARRIPVARMLAALAMLALLLIAVGAGWREFPGFDAIRALSPRVADMLGWAAAALTIATFSCRDPLYMRPLAVCTNLIFVGYALFAGLAPVLALHGMLLPINLWRWWQSAQAARTSRKRTRPAIPAGMPSQ